MPDEKELTAWMESLDTRVSNIEKSVQVVNRELGVLIGTAKSSIVPMLVKFVIFPLIMITGALVGVKLFLPVG